MQSNSRPEPTSTVTAYRSGPAFTRLALTSVGADVPAAPAGPVGGEVVAAGVAEGAAGAAGVADGVAGAGFCAGFLPNVNVTETLFASTSSALPLVGRICAATTHSRLVQSNAPNFCASFSVTVGILPAAVGVDERGAAGEVAVGRALHPSTHCPTAICLRFGVNPLPPTVTCGSSVRPVVSLTVSVGAATTAGGAATTAGRSWWRAGRERERPAADGSHRRSPDMSAHAGDRACGGATRSGLATAPSYVGGHAGAVDGREVGAEVGADDGGVRADLVRGAVGDDPAAVHRDQPVGEPGQQRQVVLDDDQRGPELAVDRSSSRPARRRRSGRRPTTARRAAAAPAPARAGR